MRASIFLTVLSAVIGGANACALYMDCKCHNSKTGQQDDATTQTACQYYNDNYASNYQYTPQSHHECTVLKETSGPINNCEWDQACKYAGGPDMYQYCWNKFPF
ncbi:hypothetical protein IWX90DRAFT_308318 [Phyllosticta citrichinensis]|uniref:Secreted protein n=1 Tax=Phyllosticta citrichinensis TaxID=1130410 RepID=A0ABR1XLK2_9PEZI